MTQIGFFEKYFINPFIGKYSDFKGEESQRSAFLSLGAWFIVTLGLAGVLLGLVGLLGPDVGFICIDVIGCIWIVGSICPMAALVSRVNNGSGDKTIGHIVFLNIDKLLCAICFLFLVLGILMTVTTLNSGELDPFHRGRGEVKSNPLLEQEEIVEEPIFTYQDNTPAAVEEIDDEVEEETDSAQIIDESFDPVIGSITAAADSAAILDN